MHSYYNIWLLLLSVLIGGFALSFTFNMASRIYKATPEAKKVLLPVFALISGSGLWANHLLLTSAFHNINEFSHAPIMLTISWLFAMGVGFNILNLASKPYFNFPTFIGGGIVSGIGVFAMYLSCLMAMHSANDLTFIPESMLLAVFLSGFVAFVTSLLLFWVKGYVGQHPILVKIIFAYIIATSILATNLTLNNATIINANLLTEAPDLLGNKLAGVVMTLSVICLFLLVFLVVLFYEKHGSSIFSFKLFESKKISVSGLVDGLTKLPNRKGFQRNLDRAISRGERSGNTIALAYIDLDHFKPINDNYGHHVGDIILASAASRLNAAVRGCDSLARIGGDEFIAIIEDIKSNEDIVPIVERMVNAIREPFLVSTQKIEISCSIGIAIYPGDGDTERLMVCADSAMYKAKENGKNQFKFYDIEIESAADEMLEMQRDLLIAIKNKEFSLVFQPKLDCKTQTPVGAEALIHWHHPTKGLIQPEYFIASAEHFGLINQINDWVIEEACSTIYRAKMLNLDLNLAINLSQQQFRNMHLVKETIKRFDNYGVPAQNITLEIKETSAMSNEVQFKRLLAQFKAAGIKIALDDFGFHPFTFDHLKELNVDEVKLNSAFTSKIDTDKAARKFTEAIIHLAQTLNFNVVADGVTTETQRQALAELGCNHMQSYLLAEPISEAQLFKFLKEHSFNNQLAAVAAKSALLNVAA